MDGLAELRSRVHAAKEMAMYGALDSAIEQLLPIEEIAKAESREVPGSEQGFTDVAEEANDLLDQLGRMARSSKSA